MEKSQNSESFSQDDVIGPKMRLPLPYTLRTVPEELGMQVSDNAQNVDHIFFDFLKSVE